MLGRIRKASSTLFWEISSRVMLTSIGWSYPSRMMVTCNLGALGALEHFRHLRGIQPVGGFAVDFRHDVARAQAGAKSRRPGNRRHHNGHELAHLAGARLDRHADAVVLALLVFAERAKARGSKKFEWGSRVRSAPGMAPVLPFGGP